MPWPQHKTKRIHVPTHNQVLTLTLDQDRNEVLTTPELMKRFVVHIRSFIYSQSPSSCPILTYASIPHETFLVSVLVFVNFQIFMNEL